MACATCGRGGHNARTCGSWAFQKPKPPKMSAHDETRARTAHVTTCECERCGYQKSDRRAHSDGDVP